MKKLALFAALLGLTTSAYTNEMLPITASCKSIEENNKFLQGQYKEYPFAGGPSVIRMADGRLIEGEGKIYVDPDKKGFTVLIEFAQIDKSCVVLMGDEFSPIVGGNAT